MRRFFPLESAVMVIEFSRSRSQYSNLISYFLGEFGLEHLTKRSKSAKTQLRDWWLVFPRLNIQLRSRARIA
jgi:hypothetical protein